MIITIIDGQMCLARDVSMVIDMNTGIPNAPVTVSSSEITVDVAVVDDMYTSTDDPNLGKVYMLIDDMLYEFESCCLVQDCVMQSENRPMRHIQFVSRSRSVRDA